MSFTGFRFVAVTIIKVLPTWPAMPWCSLCHAEGRRGRWFQCQLEGSTRSWVRVCRFCEWRLWRDVSKLEPEPTCYDDLHSMCLQCKELIVKASRQTLAPSLAQGLVQNRASHMDVDS